jgi:phosphatidylglycerophosphate synthase
VSGTLISPELRARVRGLMTPIAIGLGRLGLSPNALTVIGFLIAVVAAVAAGVQAWLLAGILVIFGGVFDLFDGALARATNRVSKAGAFMDSTFDRWGEGVIYVGITAGGLAALLNPVAILSAAAMASAFMVSYTRAKAESLGFVPGRGMANVGLAPREVRLVILTVGLIWAGIAGVGPTGSGGIVLEASLGLIALLATITTIQRIVATLRQAAASDG